MHPCGARPSSEGGHRRHRLPSSWAAGRVTAGHAGMAGRITRRRAEAPGHPARSGHEPPASDCTFCP